MTIVDAPPRNLYDVGVWLFRQDPELAKLVHEIGCIESDGMPDVGRVRDSVISFDAFRQDRQQFRRKNGLRDHDETPESMSITLGPQPTTAVARMMLMAPGEIARLRLLATTAPVSYTGPNLQWSVDDLAPFNASGHRLISLWIAGMSAYVELPADA